VHYSRPLISGAALKTLHFIESLGRGGAENLVVTLLPELQRQGDEVAVVVMRGPMDLASDLEAAGIRIHQLLPRHKWHLLGAAKELSALARHGGFEVVHAHLYFPAVVTALAKRLGWLRAATVVTFHNLAYASGANKAGPGLRFRRWLAARLYPRGFTVCLGVSGAVAAHYQAALGLKKPVKVLHNPVSPLALQRPVSPILDDLATAQLVVPGRLVHEKGHLDLLQALPSLLAQGRKLRVTFAGGGPLEGDLSREIQRLGLASVVSMLGPQDHGAMLSAMAEADIVVVPSRFEGFGLTALEGMALGRPVLATTAGGLPEVIEHGVSGWLVPPNDPAALAQGLANLLGDVPLRARLAAAGRQRAQEKFSLAAIAAQLRSIYEEAILGASSNNAR
jgi:glycosyltransferase involved in cell wall biosynthesis